MKQRRAIWALIFALALCVTGARAQSTQQNSQSSNPAMPIPPLDSGESGYNKPPAPAARGVSTPDDQQAYDPSQVVPDTNTLSGIQLLGVGSLEHARNIFDPSVSFSEQGQDVPNNTGQVGQTTQLSLASNTLMNGILDFDRTWSRYHLIAIYNGGETFYRGPYILNQQNHDVNISQEVDWDRWRLLLREEFSATPGAIFAGTGTGGPGLIAEQSVSLGTSLSGIGQLFVPNESIETGNAMRYRNSAVGQVEYSLSRRSAFTFSGSYGLLHFTQTGYVDSQMVNGQAGYDYLLDPKNSIAILAGYGKIDFTGTNSSTTEYMAGFAYGRKITGRLAFQVGAGPQQVRSAGGTGDFQLWLEAVNSALTYNRRRSGLSFTYVRGLTAGSGVFLGSKSNTFTGSAHYEFTRFWTGAVSGGYALNSSLVPAGTPEATYDNWFIGANLSRQVGPHAFFNFNYGLHRQDSSASCPVESCGVTGNQQTFGITVNWHFRRTELGST